jgi:hypothetical protein
VFLNAVQKPFITGTIANVWRGRPDRKLKTKEEFMPGIVTQLVLDGKLNNYIEPYSTRRTFVLLMAQKYDPKTVANYVGDNVEIILKHYYSGKENFTPDFSFE